MTTATYIDRFCDGCGKRLRVAAEHAGKRARCPHCQAIYTVPERNTVSNAGFELVQPAVPTEQLWQLKSPEGLVYGPVSKEALDRWRDEGRIIRASQLLPTGGQQWLWATDVYPELTKAAPMVAVPVPHAATDGGRPTTPTLHSYYASGIEPHRGPLVLVASILGVTTLCAIPSLIALALGLYDLRLMKAGKMDSSGRNMTIAGVVLGAIWTVFTLSVLVLGLVAWMMR